MNNQQKTSVEVLRAQLESGETILDKRLLEWSRINTPAYRGDWKIYRHKASGQIYFQPHVFSTIFRFKSAALFRSTIQNIQQNSTKKEHPFSSFITDTVPLFRHTDETAATISITLSIPLESLDLSMQSVRLIQAGLLDLPRDYDFFGEENALTYALACYIGDIVYMPTGGWTYRTDRDGKTILPGNIKLPNGSSYNWFKDFVGYLVEKEFDKLEYIVSSVVRM